MVQALADERFAGGGNKAELAARGTVKERKTFLLPMPGDEEFQFFQMGIVWVEPPPLWSMNSPIAVRARNGLKALVEHCENRGSARRSIRWFLRRVADQDWPFVPRERSLQKMPDDIRQHVLNVCELRRHWLLSPVHDLGEELGSRLLDIAAMESRRGRLILAH